MNLKKILLTLNILILVFSISVLISFAQAEYTIKVGHVDPEGDWTMGKSTAYAHMFKAHVESVSEGKIKVEVYPAMQLGGEAEMLSQVSVGSLQIYLGSDGPLAGFYPLSQVASVPFIFKNNVIAHQVLTGPFGQELSEACAKESGLRIIGVGEIGFRNFVSNKPITSLQDLKGQKIRTMENPAQMKIVNSMGAVATPISYAELYTSLQQGVIDGMEGSPYMIETHKFYEVTKYMVIDGHLYSPVYVVINDAFYQGLPKEYRDIINEANYLASRMLFAHTAYQNATFVPMLAEKGLEVVYPSQELLNELKNISQPAVVEWLIGELDNEGMVWLKKLENAIQKAETDFYGESTFKIIGLE